MLDLKNEPDETHLGWRGFYHDIKSALKIGGSALYDTLHWYYLDHDAKKFMDEIKELPALPWIRGTDGYLVFPFKCRITKEEVLLAVQHVHAICIAYGNAEPSLKLWIRHHKLEAIVEICMQYIETFKEDTGYDPVISKATG